MAASGGGGIQVTVAGVEHATDQAAFASLRAAVERVVQAHRPAGFTIREVVVVLEEGGSSAGTVEPAPVYVDVYDSGYGHGI